ncbi:hypothetical protein [Blastococcus capsensis]|uniref:hypothetical protein n=1 Tax=Blastococcus capsensis TaxID=1564163 RepID=UPI0025407561|nr:hypothetical protein [Blastococcus capsensis]MDK3256715.1 hypothetical protein [Blastococcus capsensis]
MRPARRHLAEAADGYAGGQHAAGPPRLLDPVLPRVDELPALACSTTRATPAG